VLTVGIVLDDENALVLRALLLWWFGYGKKSRAVLSTSCKHTPPDLPPPTLVGRLEKIDAASIVMAGGMRVFIRPGLWFPGFRLGTNLSVWGHLKHGAICADWVEPADTPESGHSGIELTRRRERAGILMKQARESVVLCRQVVDALKEQTPRLTPRRGRDGASRSDPVSEPGGVMSRGVETLKDGSARRFPERRRSSLPLPKEGLSV